MKKNNTVSKSINDWESNVNKINTDVISFCEDSDPFFWMSFLGVVSEPNPLDDWDQLYNLNNQCVLRNDCRTLANNLKNKRSVPELESFLTLYCKKRNIDYVKDFELKTILEKILHLNLPQSDEFNVFFAFTTKYIPNDTKKDAQVFQLFRLLLQYHDPQLSNCLESLHCDPYSYSKKWFATLFSSSMPLESCHALWKIYIKQGDPFLVFYLAIVFLINAKEEMLKIDQDEKEKALLILENMAAQLNVDDVPDFMQLAFHYSNETPKTICEDFYDSLFGSNFDKESRQVNLEKLLCLPISTQDFMINDEVTSNVNFFIVDTRSSLDFDLGHVVSSFNLDCSAIVDDPEKFEHALQSLESYKNSRRLDDHYLILGYGTELHDKYMNMLISMFIQRGEKHVSSLHGGFKKLHDSIESLQRWDLIAMHNEEKCKMCLNSQTNSKWKLFSKMKSVVTISSTKMKERVESVVFPDRNIKMDEKLNHVDSKQRHGKRYKQQSVFTIDENSDDEINSEAAIDENRKEEILISKEFIETFECEEVFRESSITGHFALTRTHIHVLHDVPDKKGYVTTAARHALSTVVAVTCRKSVPELLTFKLGYELNGSSKITAIHKLYIPKAGECAKAVKLAIFALRPLPVAQTHSST